MSRAVIRFTTGLLIGYCACIGFTVMVLGIISEYEKICEEERIY